MRVLVTGGMGRIGRYVVQRLVGLGHEARTFDRAARARDAVCEHLPGDLRNASEVRRAMDGVDAVVHLGAVPNDMGDPEQLLGVNVAGTWNVLLAAVEAGAGKVVFFSSVNALGNFNGHRASERLPIRDDYPRHPISPYQLSKHLGEEMCRSFTESQGIRTICLRPVWVLAPDQYTWRARRSEEQRIEWHKGDYWAYVDVRDVVDAAVLALDNGTISHGAFLLAAEDTHVETPTRELLRRFYPDTPWVGATPDAYFADNPNRSVVDCSEAGRLLGWRPVHSWRNQTEAD